MTGSLDQMAGLGLEPGVNIREKQAILDRGGAPCGAPCIENAELQSVIDAWPHLSESARLSILELVKS